MGVLLVMGNKKTRRAGDQSGAIVAWPRGAQSGVVRMDTVWVSVMR